MSEFLAMVPPHSDELERAVLGCVLMDWRSFDAVVELVQARHFYRSSNRVIFDAMHELWSADQPIDFELLAEKLKSKGQLEAAGGVPALTELTVSVPTAANAEFYSERLRGYALRRRVIQVSAQVARTAHDWPEGTEGLASQVEQLLYDATHEEVPSQEVGGEQLAGELMDQFQAAAKGEGSKGVLTGWYALDQLTRGLHPEQLVIVAARPSVGKTTLALNLLRRVTVEDGHSGAMFSLEMPRRDLGVNLCSGMAGLDAMRVREGTLSRQETARYTDAALVLEGAPIWVDDHPELDTSTLRAKTRRLVRERGVKVVLVDYLQLMRAAGDLKTRQEEVSEISRTCKLLARECGVAVVALAQLSRKLEERRDKTPQLSDLRESGSIEQDADQVWLLQRPERDHTDPDKVPPHERNLLRLHLAKNRNGPTGTVDFRYLAHCYGVEPL